MKKIVYLLASGVGGAWLGKIVYTVYAYIQLVAVNDYTVGGIFWYKLIGFVIGFIIGRYWQLSYKYWDLMSFSPVFTRK